MGLSAFWLKAETGETFQMIEEVLAEFSRAFVTSTNLSTMQVYEQVLELEPGLHQVGEGRSADQLEVLIAVKSSTAQSVGFLAVTTKNYYPRLPAISLEQDCWEFPIERKHVFIFPKYHRVWFELTSNATMTLRIARLLPEYSASLDKYQWMCLYHHESLWECNAARLDPTDMNIVGYRNGLIDLSGFTYAPLGGNVAVWCYMKGWDGIHIKCTKTKDYYMLPNSRAIANVMFMPQARLIQQMWRHAVECPEYELCCKRLKREFITLSNQE